MNNHKEKFEICVRGVIFKNKKILVCRNKEKGYFYFPGGHVEFGESAKQALVRELNEELKISIKKVFYIGGGENIFNQEGKKHHEINLIFNVSVDSVDDKSREDYIDFFFFGREKFLKEKVLPVSLQKAVINWQKNEKMFWISQSNKN